MNGGEPPAAFLAFSPDQLNFRPRPPKALTGVVAHAVTSARHPSGLQKQYVLLLSPLPNTPLTKRFFMANWLD